MDKYRSMTMIAFNVATCNMNKIRIMYRYAHTVCLIICVCRTCNYRVLHSLTSIYYPKHAHNHYYVIYYILTSAINMPANTTSMVKS
jgi:hypothetical protein